MRHVLVDEDAVVDVEAGVLGELDIGEHADADDDEVGGDAVAGRGLDGDDAAALPDDRGRPAVLRRMSVPQPRWRSRKWSEISGATTRPISRSARLEHGHRLAEVARGRGDLEADEAAADDHHVARPMQALAELARIVDVAEREDAVEVNALDRRQPRPRAGGERELAEGDGGTVGEDDLALAEIDAGRLGAEAELDRVLLVEGLRPERQEIVDRILEEGLRQRRPLIGHVALGGDQRQRAGKALFPQARGQLAAAMAAADDDDRVFRH